MTFEYLQRVVVEAQIDVDNIGECALRGRNDLGEEFYLVTRSDMGWTELIQFGPVSPECEILPFNISLTYNRFEFNQTRIMKAIEKFLNDPKKLITQADVVEQLDIRGNILDSINKIIQ